MKAGRPPLLLPLSVYDDGDLGDAYVACIVYNLVEDGGNGGTATPRF